MNEIPIKKPKVKSVPYSILLPIDLKIKLEELKAFDGVDTAEWVRMLISDAVDIYENNKKKS